ncbi:hypothetical protein D9V32_06695 [Mycetocola tolaasinivorans]|uniref:Uncharacterized protein n=1 Tax=Mycetocola tolaasinivorans TaxID=76635 RepID=A0A3L7A869_9MICO|nr:hypothetical protein [Mycetocola tolaasinivorans]RLP76533.1 hypothetical protein D9V32_06695 [Mycetocola tolaasinivorans]
MTESTSGKTPADTDIDADAKTLLPAEADIQDSSDSEGTTDPDLDAVAPSPAPPMGKLRRGIQIAITVVFGLLFAYQVWGGVGSAITLPRQVAAIGGSISALGWTMIILSIVAPLVAFYVSYRVGRRRGWISMILTYLVGVAASFAIALSIAAAFFLT